MGEQGGGTGAVTLRGLSQFKLSIVGSRTPDLRVRPCRDLWFRLSGTRIARPVECSMMSRIARFLPKDPYHLILLALPWLLLAANVNWPFGNGDNWDPWFYWGHAHAFPRV